MEAASVPEPSVPTKPAKNGGASDRAKSERKLAYMLCAPAVIAMLIVTGYPIGYAFYLSLLLLGAHAIGTGIAALLDGTMRRWVGWGGICVGILQFAGVAVQGMADGVVYAPLLWTVWFFGLAICLIRRRATKKAIPVAA